MKTLDSTLPRSPYVDLLSSGHRAPSRQVSRVSAVVDRVFLWQERMTQRRHMRGLSDHELKDIGLSRADIEQEESKPFWVG